MNDARVVLLGDATLVVEFEERIDAGVNARCVAAASVLSTLNLAGIRDIVPTFRSVAVHFDPLATDLADLTRHMQQAADRGQSSSLESARATVEIPVCYDPEFGLDLEEVARFAGSDAETVIATHLEPEYRVFMLGFVPGFAYLGVVDERIAAPRRASPRLQVPRGSVGIAGQQTGIYPSTTPGGWNIIGRTPLAMVNFTADKVVRIEAGDAVRFRRIDRDEFERLAAQSESAL
jgi:KipI family sensor histidine kinase inhibitor